MKNGFSILCFIGVFLVAAGNGATAADNHHDLASLFTGAGGDIWGASPVDFFSAVNLQGTPPSFDWTSQTEKNRARYPAWQNSPEITLLGFPLYHAVAHFEDNGLQKLECSFYNKGDAEVQKDQNSGVIYSQDVFVSRLKKYAGRVDAWVGKKGENLDPRRLTTSGAKMMRRVWIKKPYLIEMRWAFTEDRNTNGPDFLGEYINIVFSRYTREKDPTIAHVSSVHDRYKGWAQDKDRSGNIKTNFQGDKYIDGIPMVDQGEKGYCVVAALERIMRYYGADIDQHALAQLGKSSGRQGTIMEQMIDTLEKADTKLGIYVDVEYNIGEDIRDYERLVRKYNRTAKRLDKPEIEDEQWVIQHDRGRTYVVPKLISLLNPEVYKKTRNEYFETDSAGFKRILKKEIAAGRPILWGVWLGIFAEPGIRLQGGSMGHARLIIGYNAKKDQLLYSDTWGRGHELKRMPFDEAWAITTFLTTITPRRRQY